jgi:hypothetical protein
MFRQPIQRLGYGAPHHGEIRQAMIGAGERIDKRFELIK